MQGRIIYLVAATYIGAVMGAGFASGQEIQQFFIRFGHDGIYGIMISTALFMLFGWMTMELLINRRIKSYTEFFVYLFGLKWGKKFNIIIDLFLLLGLVAMLSGSGALFAQYFGISSWLGIIFTNVIIGLALINKEKGVLWINSVLIPIKFIICLGIGILAINYGFTLENEGSIIVGNPIIKNWYLSGILYVSFNITLAMVILSSVGKEIQKPEARWGAMLGGFVLGIFALIIGWDLLIFPEMQSLEIPMVGIARKLGVWSAFFYAMVLWFAMITAAISNSFSLVQRVAESGWLKYGQSAVVIMGLAIAMSWIKFSSLVAHIYPLFAYLGLGLIPALIWAWKKRPR